MKKITILILMLLLSIQVVIGATVVGTDRIDGRTNGLLSTSSNKLGFLIPAIMLAVTIICFAIDFGATGVSMASAISLLVLYLMRIIYIDIVSLASFIIIIIIMVYKISR